MSEARSKDLVGRRGTVRSVRLIVAIAGALIAMLEIGPTPLRAAPTRDADHVAHFIRFQTGTDPGRTFPAAECRIAPLGEQQLECWSPNDGYTIRLNGYGIG